MTNGLRGFVLSSRGDRVRGCWTEPEGGRPLAIVAGPEGRADDDLVKTVLDAWPWDTVVGFDLPLCGGRHSDKLSQTALDPGEQMAERLRPDLEIQIACDVAVLINHVVQHAGERPSRVALVCAGRGQSWAADVCEARGLVDLVVRADGSPAWLDAGADALRA